MIFLLLILISNISFSQYKLEIDITEIRNNNGKLMIQFFDENEQIIKQEIGTIKDKKWSVSIENLKAGKYAIRYFHDENLNGNLETNLVGKPTEGYGFSNNVVGKYSMPPFEKWLFDLNGDKKLVLKPTY